MSPRVYERRFDWDEAARLYEAGASGMEVAARFGVTPKAVYDVLDRFGIERRSPIKTVRDAELQCANCRAWKPDDDFPHNRAEPSRRGRHQNCRGCQTELRQQYRLRNQVPCTNCGEPRLSAREINGASRGHRDTGLCLECYRASVTKAAA